MKQCNAISRSLYSQGPHSNVYLGETRKGGTPAVAHIHSNCSFPTVLWCTFIWGLRNIELLPANWSGFIQEVWDHPCPYSTSNYLSCTLLTINRNQFITPQLPGQRCELWTALLCVLQETWTLLKGGVLLPITSWLGCLPVKWEGWSGDRN